MTTPYVPGDQPAAEVAPYTDESAYSGYLAEIYITPTEVRTPVGTFRRSTTTWSLGTPVEGSTTPTWAMVLAILLIPCTAFLSLLLLLAKEPDGVYRVPLTLTDGRAEYRTILVVAGQPGYTQAVRIVNWARTGQ